MWVPVNAYPFPVSVKEMGGLADPFDKGVSKNVRIFNSKIENDFAGTVDNRLHVISAYLENIGVPVLADWDSYSDSPIPVPSIKAFNWSIMVDVHNNKVFHEKAVSGGGVSTVLPNCGSAQTLTERNGFPLPFKVANSEVSPDLSLVRDNGLSCPPDSYDCKGCSSKPEGCHEPLCKRVLGEDPPARFADPIVGIFVLIIVMTLGCGFPVLIILISSPRVPKLRNSPNQEK